MTKLTRIPTIIACLGASFGFSTVNAGPTGGGSSTSDLIAQQIARSQQLKREAIEHMNKGQQLEADGDLEGAVAQYVQAVGKLPDAPATRDLRFQAISLYARAGVKAADQRARSGDFTGARNLLNNILSDDIAPGYEPAKKTLRRLDDPEWYNPSANKTTTENVERVKGFLAKGYGYEQLGEYDLAFKEYEEVLRIDQHNISARRGMERVDGYRREYYDHAQTQTRARMLAEVAKRWETPVTPRIVSSRGDLGPAPEEDGLIRRKLNEIKVSVQFDGASLSEALEFLEAKSKELDPFTPGEGVSFFVTPETDSSGAPVPSPPIRLTLNNVPLIEAVKFICEAAQKRYSIEPYAVKILPIYSTDSALITRTFRVPPSFLEVEGSGGGAAPSNPFESGFGGGDSSGSANAIKPRPTAKEVLESRGVTFAADAVAIYNPSTSTLLVRNTQNQMELVETYIEQIVNVIPKNIRIETKFIEVTQENTEEVGFDWLLGGFNIGSERLFGSGGTVGNQLPNGLDSADFAFTPPVSTGGTPVPVGNNLLTAGLRSGNLAIASDAIDGLLSAVPSSSQLAPGIFGVAGVFTDPQFQVIVRALNQKKGADLMSAPSVLTKPGQRATIEVIREFIYPEEYEPPEIPQDFGSINGIGGGGGIGGIGGVASVNSFPVVPANPTSFTMRPVGVTLVVDPNVGPDGYTIDLNIAPEVVEFEGFINYGSPINTTGTDALGRPVTLVLTQNEIKQPVFAARKLQSNVTIYDGSTVAIGGLIREDVQQTEDKVPFFGDIPLAGRLFRSRAESSFKRNLMVFVKAELVDPSGQPIRDRVVGAEGSSAIDSGLFPG